MFHKGYAVVEVTDSNAVVATDPKQLPLRVRVNGVGIISFSAVGQTTDAEAERVFKLLELWRDNTPPGADVIEAPGRSVVFRAGGEGEDDIVVDTPNWRDMTPQEIADRDAAKAEVERRRLVPKLLIVQRLIAAGKAAKFKQALTGAALEKWQARMYVPAGHVGLRNLLTNIGADPDAILAAGEPDDFD